MSNYLETLQSIKDNMQVKKTAHIKWSSENIKALLKTGTDGVHGLAVCKSILSRLRTDPAYQEKYAHEIREYELENDVKLTPLRKRKKTTDVVVAEKTNNRTAECKINELELNVLAVKSMFQSGLDYKEIAKVLGRNENTVIALLKVAETFTT